MLKKIIGGLVKAFLLALLVAFLVVFSAVLAWSLGSGEIFGPSSFVTNHSGWPTVEGTVSYYSGQDNEGYVDVTFVYEVQEESYTSTQSWRWEDHKYSTGDKVTVYYDSANPHIAVIEPENSQWAFETLLVGYWSFLAFSIGAGLVYAGIVVWAWVSNVVSHKLEAGREIAVWSWVPNRMRVWRIIGVTVGLIPFFYALISPRAPALLGLGVIFWVFVGVYLITPVALAILLRTSKSFQCWLGARIR